MDLSRQLKLANGTGSLLFGQRQTEDACGRGDAKCIIVAANCPTDYITAIRARHPEVTMHQTNMVNRELGVACGKPFSISTVCIIDAGTSTLLALDANIE